MIAILFPNNARLLVFKNMRFQSQIKYQRWKLRQNQRISFLVSTIGIGSPIFLMYFWNLSRIIVIVMQGVLREMMASFTNAMCVVKVSNPYVSWKDTI
jgi:hypothetical protein